MISLSIAYHIANNHIKPKIDHVSRSQLNTLPTNPRDPSNKTINIITDRSSLSSFYLGFNTSIIITISDNQSIKRHTILTLFVVSSTSILCRLDYYTSRVH